MNATSHMKPLSMEEAQKVWDEQVDRHTDVRGEVNIETFNKESETNRKKLWSHAAAQRGFWRPGSVLEVEGLGRGQMQVINGERLFEECDPPGCGPSLAAWARDEQEALSRRYGAGTLWLLPLESGRFAIFSADRQLASICEEVPSAEALRGWSEEASKRSLERQVLGRREAVGASEEKMEDLGL